MSSALNRWTAAILAALLLILAGSTGMLLWSWQRPASGEPEMAINRARLAVHPVLLYLEREQERLSRPEVRDTLQEMTAAQGLTLTVAGLDGSVLYASDGAGGRGESPPEERNGERTEERAIDERRGGELGSQTADELSSQTPDELSSQISDELSSQISDGLGPQTPDELGSQRPAPQSDPLTVPRIDPLSDDRIDLRTALHYDLYAARTDEGSYRIAFPLLDERTGIQYGHALFVLPQQLIRQPSPQTPLLGSYGAVAGGSLLLLGLVLLLRRQARRQVREPLQQMREDVIALLRGDYAAPSAPIRHPRSGAEEIGELRAVVDQLRLSLLHQSGQQLARDQAQQELISTISHELKTPLTTVKAYIEAILAGVCGDREAILAYVEVMQTHTDKMARQVEDLLLHALQELGQLPVTPREQYSGQTLRRMLEPLCHAIRTRGVACVEPAAIPDVLLPLDAVRIEQVLTNLVYNALKHTSTGDTIRLEVEQEPGQLRLLVADTGPGVLPQDMPFLFDRYYRGQATPAADGSQPEGTGLGLSICKHIVEAHGGTIGFRSRPGEGTVFHFTLPLS